MSMPTDDASTPTEGGEARRAAPRFIVPVPVGSVAPAATEPSAASESAATAPRPPAGPPRARPDAVVFGVTLLWVALALSIVGLGALVVATAIAAEVAAQAGVGSDVVATGAVVALGVGVVVLALQAVLTVLVARGSDVARAWLAIVTAAVVVLALVAGGTGAGALGAVVLVVAVAALFVPSSSAWFGQLRVRRAR